MLGPPTRRSRSACTGAGLPDHLIPAPGEATRATAPSSAWPGSEAPTRATTIAIGARWDEGMEAPSCLPFKATRSPQIVLKFGRSQIRRQHGERRCDDEVIMAASRLQSQPAACARLEDELSKLPAQKFAAGRMLVDSQGCAPHGGAEPPDQPRLADDQAVSLRRAGERAIAADEADVRSA